MEIMHPWFPCLMPFLHYVNRVAQRLISYHTWIKTRGPPILCFTLVADAFTQILGGKDQNLHQRVSSGERVGSNLTRSICWWYFAISGWREGSVKKLNLTESLLGIGVRNKNKLEEKLYGRHRTILKSGLSGYLGTRRWVTTSPRSKSAWLGTRLPGCTRR